MDVDIEHWTVGGGVKAKYIWAWTHRPVQVAHWAIWPRPWSPARYLAATVSPQWPMSLTSRRDAVSRPSYPYGLASLSHIGARAANIKGGGVWSA